MTGTGRGLVSYEIAFHAPDVLLSANDRRHWRSRAQITRQWRKAAWAYAVQAKTPALTSAGFVITFTHPTLRRRDASNLHPTVKAIIDGLVDAGVLPDDDDAHVTGTEILNTVDRALRIPYVSVRIWPDHPAGGHA